MNGINALPRSLDPLRTLRKLPSRGQDSNRDAFDRPRERFLPKIVDPEKVVFQAFAD
jgi:hypothetical protein